MRRDELITSREYWITKIQLDLFNQIENYMIEHQLSRTQLAEKLGVTKGYVSQIMNGDFDHKISKLVDLALLIGKAPDLKYPDLEEYKGMPRKASSIEESAFSGIIKGGQTQRFAYAETHLETTTVDGYKLSIG